MSPTRGRPRFAFPALLFVVCALCAHADTLVVPNADATTYGISETFAIFGNGSDAPGTFQWLFAASQLTSLTGMDITGIGFRLPGGDLPGEGHTNITSPTTIGPFDIELSGSLNPVGSLNPNPAGNIAPGGVTVYDNPSLIIPANSLVNGPGPTPGPFYTIQFTTSYLYTGGPLLITLTQPNIALIPVDADGDAAVGDTAQCNPFGCGAHTYLYPVTEFDAAPAVPEPSSIVPLAGSLALCFLWMRRRKAAQKGASLGAPPLDPSSRSW